MRTRWLAACGLLLSGVVPAAAQSPTVTAGLEASSSPDRPTDLPPLLPVPQPTPPAVPGPTGPRSEYDPGYQYIPEQSPQGGKLPPCPCRPLGRWWVAPSLELGWAPTTSAPRLLRLLVPDPRTGATPGPVLPLGEHTGTTFRVGMGLTGGVWLDRCQNNGVEAGFFFLGNEERTTPGNFPGGLILFPDGSSRGEPVALRLPDPSFTGAFPVTTANWYASADVNYRRTLHCEDNYRLDALFGYRFGSLTDEVYLGDPRENEDRDHRLNRLATANTFHGGQVGLAGEYRFTNGWYVTGTGKAAFGAVFTDVIAGGLFTGPQVGTGAGFLPAPVPTGSSNRFAVLPTLNLGVGRQIGDRGRVFAGYSFQYLNRVARLADVVDTTGGLKLSDFWAQSVSLGMELRF